MKTLILSFVLSLFSFLAKSQETYYMAVQTEMYLYNQKTDSWDLHQKNGDVKIRIVVEEQFVTFQAKSPSMYKIYLNTKEPLETTSLTGYRYSAKDLKKDVMVKLDIVRSKNSAGAAMLSIVNNTEGINLRFFLIDDN